MAYQLNLKVKNEFLSLILVHEFNIAKKSGVIPNKKGMMEFVFITNSIEWKEYFFEKYIGIEDRLTNWVNKTTEYILFFIEYLHLDREHIHNTYKVNIDDLEDIILFEGDVHNSGKFVLKTLFNKGVNLFFKPRDSYNEQLFTELIHFCSLTTDVYAELPIFLSFNDHSWSNELKYSNNFRAEEDIKKYYENIGRIMAIFYLLGASDIIPDNLIISNNKPGFFDIEAITTKPLLLNNHTVRGRFTESVRRIGILPEMMNSSIDRNSWILSSVLFRFNNQEVTNRVWNIDHESLETTTSTFLGSNDRHIPMMENSYKELTYDLLSDLIRGFRHQYTFFLNNKKAIYSFIQTRGILIKRVRVIFHPTSIYSQLRDQSYIPEFYKDRHKLYDLIQTMVKGLYTDGFIVDEKQLSDSIYKQVSRFDIPYFYLDSTTRSLYDGTGIKLADWGVDPQTQILNNLSEISKNDLECQLNIIELSCRLTLDNFSQKEYLKKDVRRFRSINNIIPTKLNKNILLKAASSIGDYLLSKAIIQDDEINWVSKVRSSGGRYSVSLLNYDLYDGLSGTCILFINLYKATQEIRYKTAAKRLYGSLIKVAKTWSEVQYIKGLPIAIKESFPISPYSFPASLIYLTFQDSCFSTEDNWKVIDSVIKDLTYLNTISVHDDYLLGRFGLLDLLLNTKDVFPESLKETAERLTNEVINELLQRKKSEGDYTYWEMYDTRNTMAVGGFAHGSSSAAYVLAKGQSVLNMNLQRYIEGALKYDRSFFDSETLSWLDNREDDNIKNDPVSWCHGTSGVILGRMVMSSFINNKDFTKEYTFAEKNLLNKGLHLNDSICHGSLGNLEILYSLANITGHEHIRSSIYQFLNSFSENIIQDITIFKNGSGGTAEIIGLFTGLAGAAFQLLRFYNWQTVPSILCLEIPQSLNPILHEA